MNSSLSFFSRQKIRKKFDSELCCELSFFLFTSLFFFRSLSLTRSVLCGFSFLLLFFAGKSLFPLPLSCVIGLCLCVRVYVRSCEFQIAICFFFSLKNCVCFSLLRNFVIIQLMIGACFVLFLFKFIVHFIDLWILLYVAHTGQFIEFIWCWILLEVFSTPRTHTEYLSALMCGLWNYGPKKMRDFSTERK